MSYPHLKKAVGRNFSALHKFLNMVFIQKRKCVAVPHTVLPPATSTAFVIFFASARSNRPTFGANILTSLAGRLPPFKSDLDRLLVHFFYLQILFSAVKNGCEIKDIAHTSHNFLLQLMLVVLFWNTNVAQCYL